MSKQSNDDQASVENESTPTLDTPASNDKDTQAEAMVMPSNTPIGVKKPSNKLAVLALLLSFISLGIIASGGYYGYKMHLSVEQDKQQWQSNQASQMQQLQSELNAQMSKARDDLAAVQQQSLNKINHSLAGNLTAVDRKIAEISGRQPSDWAIAEANYLVRMAARKLWLENDSQTAQHLLVTADLRIAELNNPALIPIRKAIVNDIAVVRALPQPRVTDIHLALSGLVSQLDSLPLNYVQEHRQPMSAQQNTPVSDDIGDWQQNLTTSVSTLFSKLFYFNAGVEQGSSEPYKMPRQQWFLRANVKHAWLQAQMALLSRNDVVYQEALKRSIEWLGHFKQSDNGVQMAITTLNGLLKDPIVADYPEKLESQAILEQTLRERLATVPSALQVTKPDSPAQQQGIEQ